MHQCSLERSHSNRGKCSVVNSYSEWKRDEGVACDGACLEFLALGQEDHKFEASLNYIEDSQK